MILVSIHIQKQYCSWLCLKDNALSGSQMCIVTGPRIDLAIALIDRMKKLFADGKSSVRFDTKEPLIHYDGKFDLLVRCMKCTHQNGL
jgi:hypothetical protein